MNRFLQLIAILAAIWAPCVPAAEQDDPASDKRKEAEEHAMASQPGCIAMATFLDMRDGCIIHFFGEPLRKVTHVSSRGIVYEDWYYLTFTFHFQNGLFRGYTEIE